MALQEHILTPIPMVGFGVSEVLHPVDLNGRPIRFAKQIHHDAATIIKGSREQRI